LSRGGRIWNLGRRDISDRIWPTYKNFDERRGENVSSGQKNLFVQETGDFKSEESYITATGCSFQKQTGSDSNENQQFLDLESGPGLPFIDGGGVRDV
jgi:hypothetical protein